MDLEKGRGLLERTGTDDGGKDRGGGWVEGGFFRLPLMRGRPSGNN